MKLRNMQFMILFAFGAVLCLAQAVTSFAQSKGTVVEAIVARVNNEIITLSDYQKADQALQQEVAQECQGCTPDKIEEEYKAQKKDLLRGLIDNALLVERAKDMNISVENDVIKKLDDIRKENSLASMEELEKKVEESGMAWEDLKTQIRNKLLTDEVIRREVAGHMDIPPEEVKQFYEEHKSEFVLPEQVVLSEIFLSTAGMSPEEAASVQRKADDLHSRLVRGEDFSLLAQRYSEGSTAKDGGAIGTFPRGQLDKQLEDAVFALSKNQITDVIQIKTGYEILKVNDHFAAGQQPLEKVRTQIENKLYMQKMEPAMRDYLAQLREQSYVMVKPGYTDSAAIPGTGAIQEVSPTPDTPAKKKKKKLSLPKVNG